MSETTINDPAFENDPLAAMQLEIKRHLEADSWMTGIPIVCQQQGNLIALLEEAIAKTGICVTIESLAGDINDNDVGAYSMAVRFGVTVTEHTVINRDATGTRKSATAVLARLLCLLSPLRNPPARARKFQAFADADGLQVFLIECAMEAGFEIKTTT